MAVWSRVTLITTLTDQVHLTSDRYLFVTVVIDIEFTFLLATFLRLYLSTMTHIFLFQSIFDDCGFDLTPDLSIDSLSFDVVGMNYLLFNVLELDVG